MFRRGPSEIRRDYNVGSELIFRACIAPAQALRLGKEGKNGHREAVGEGAPRDRSNTRLPKNHVATANLSTNFTRKTVNMMAIDRKPLYRPGLKNSPYWALRLLFFLFIPAVAVAQNSALEKKIFSSMDAAAKKWNAGDLDGYMALYDRSATMMMPTGRVGLDSIRGLYVKYYFENGKPRQQLSYDSYELTSLGKDFALLTGRFILKASEHLKQRSGTFSLVLVRRKEGWKILHDHSG